MSGSKQQAVQSQQPQPAAPPPPRGQRVGQLNMFVNMIEGPAISVSVGQKENIRTFVLPCGLLAHHSLYVYTYLFPPQSSFESTRKRKLSQVSCEENLAENTAKAKGPDVVIKIESDVDENETKEEKEEPMVHLQFPDVDPMVFSLFLHFIYKDAYPRHVDGVMTSELRQQYPYPPTTLNPDPQVPHVPPGASSSTNISSKSTTAYRSSQASTSATNSKAADKPTQPILTQQPPPTSSTSPPLTSNPIQPPLFTFQLANTNLYSSHTPVSIQAHFLGYRLGACAFINYTITRIHGAIGTGLLLTPNLIYTIWYRTQSLPQAPLRRLLLDYLVTYWSHPAPHTRATYIYPDEHAWETLFDHCKDLRNAFFRGMQNRVKVGDPEAYHITKKMMVDSNWNQVGRGKQDDASASSRAGPGPDSGAGKKMEGMA